MYLLISPSIMKMLKSSPMPKMKVDRMMLMILNFIPNMPMKPIMIIQLMNMGRKLISASSSLPYDSHSARKIRTEDMYSTR